MLTFIIFRRQEAFSVGLFSAYLSGNVKNIAEGHQKMPTHATFRPFEVVIML
jgi:DNA repair/transcription protein MET18/MMS19